MERNVDILIIGAGISGIGVAAHLAHSCPNRSFNIVEARKQIGGTWDLFKYPGIRSDSDMLTFSYRFKPWQSSQVLATAPAIKDYLHDVVSDYKLYDKIHFEHRVLAANYDSQERRWYLTIQDQSGQTQRWIANFVISCTGYYNYKQGFTPRHPEQEQFQGTFVHPQHWPEQLDYSHKKIVVIGSGATAITLVPALLKGGAKHVTMLQRSPTYVLPIPSVDVIYDKLHRILPNRYAAKIARLRNIRLQRTLYAVSQKWPKVTRKVILKTIKMQLKDKTDIRHFSPSYNPWDQRLCVVPDGDLFKSLRSGQASVVTDSIEKFTQTGIQLKSGLHLDADIIVSATGLNIQILGGIHVTINEQPVDPAQTMLYKGVLVSGIPNMAMILGYINASWTLKVDIAADYICRLLNHMQQYHFKEVVAPTALQEMTPDTVMGDLSAGYIQRAADIMPKQGKHAPWLVTNNYFYDQKALKKAQFNDGILQFK